MVNLFMIGVLHPLLWTLIGQLGRVTNKGNEAKSKMKISYAHADIQTQVVVICGPMCFQLDHEGDKDNNYVFVVLLILTIQLSI